MATEVNKLTWDLDSIFPGGSDSTEFGEFKQSLATDIEEAQKAIANLPRDLNKNSMIDWIDYFLWIQDLSERLDHASGFVSCLTAQDVNDDKASLFEQELAGLYGTWEVIMTGIEAFAAGADDDWWTKLVTHEKLIDVRFFWDEQRSNARLKMDPQLEKLGVELSVDGYHAWDRIYTKMAGDLKAEFVEDGKTKSLSMGQLSNKFSSPDRAVRQQAFTSMEQSWARVDSLAAMMLNSQAGFRLSLYKGRNWDSPLFEPLLNGRLQKETIAAMWKAVERGGKKMSAYIDAKKNLLGIDSFKWFDQTAPVGEVTKSYTYDEAAQFVVKHLSSFSQDLGSFAEMAINNRWIEAEDRSGKAAGGFCTGVDLKKQSRIFMTFSGNFDEMMTLAHELGHAYHSWVLRDQDYFARYYPMNLAETASTFNELLVTDAALESCQDDKEKLVLLDQKIQQGFIMFCNIRARFLFDSCFYDERKNGPVPKKRLNEMMVTAQKTAFGDILADDGYHPLFWASKLHFFYTRAPFYNFPYTFGFLFAGGIYDQAKKEGPAFAESYKALLSDTGSMTTEEVAQKHLGLDLTTNVFWDAAVDRVLKDIDPFIELARKS